MKKFILFAAVILTALSSCVKNTLAPVPSKITNDPLVNGPDVYVTGTIPAANQKTIAVYWKNGVLTKLSDTTLNAIAVDIAVSGNDVYVLGYDGTHYVYWKNGVSHMITTDPTANATAIAVKGNDVYVAGNAVCSSGLGSQAVLWTNGTLHFLAYDHPYGSAANAIVLSGNDVYVAGYTTANAPSKYTMATCWKNGVPQVFKDSLLLDNGNGNHITQAQTLANAVTINGNDVYVAGVSEFDNIVDNTIILREASYWKNGTVVHPYAGTANHIAANGNNLYITGSIPNSVPRQDDLLVYWKNGTISNLPKSADQTISFIGGVTTEGNDVYTSALLTYQTNGILTPGYPESVGYYKNDTFITLKTVPIDANANSLNYPFLGVRSIVVVPH